MNSIPKIYTTEDIYDETKIVLDDTDKEIRNRNLKDLKEMNVPANPNMRDVPINSLTELKSLDKIIDRAKIEFVLATLANYKLNPEILNEQMNMQDLFDELNEETNVKNLMSNNELELVDALIYGEVDEQTLITMSWFYEASAILLWAVSLFPVPSISERSDVNELFQKITSDQQLSKAKLRSKKEILEYADLIIRYNWALTRITDSTDEIDFKKYVLDQHVLALKWVLGWDESKIMKDTINFVYEMGDISFSFNKPSNLDIADFYADSNEKQLFSLKTVDDLYKISFNCICDCNNDEYDVYTKKDIDRLKNTLWEVCFEDKVKLPGFDSDIKRCVLTYNINSTKKYGMVVYYLLINNNLISYESNMDDTIDFNNIDEIKKSLDNLDTVRLLNSVVPNKEKINSDSFRI